MSTINNYLQKHETQDTHIDVLPMLHSCECFDSRLIIESGQLEPRLCNVFNEKLLYFFYGKPSYPVGEKAVGNRTDIEYCPVCFIVNPQKVKIYRVFPFDTGAFSAGKYNGFLHRNMQIDEFELDNSIESILKYITIFFRNNDNYIRGQTIINTKGHDPYIDGLISILNAQGTHEIDDRAHTVEVISQECIFLNDAIECVIIPEDLLREDRIKAFLEQYNIRHMEYTVRTLTAPSRYNEVVFEKVMEYLKFREDGNKFQKGGKIGA